MHRSWTGMCCRGRRRRNNLSWHAFNAVQCNTIQWMTDWLTEGMHVLFCSILHPPTTGPFRTIRISFCNWMSNTVGVWIIWSTSRPESHWRPSGAVLFRSSWHHRRAPGWLCSRHGKPRRRKCTLWWCGHFYNIIPPKLNANWFCKPNFSVPSFIQMEMQRPRFEPCWIHLLAIHVRAYVGRGASGQLAAGDPQRREIHR